MPSTLDSGRILRYLKWFCHPSRLLIFIIQINIILYSIINYTYKTTNFIKDENSLKLRTFAFNYRNILVLLREEFLISVSSRLVFGINNKFIQVQLQSLLTHFPLQYRDMQLIWCLNEFLQTKTTRYIISVNIICERNAILNQEYGDGFLTWDYTSTDSHNSTSHFFALKVMKYNINNMESIC